MNRALEACTREFEECRKRWHRNTLDFVLRSARILEKARSIAGSEGRWSRWLRTRARMHPSTAYRHIRVNTFLGKHVALKRQMARLSLQKIYALSTLPEDRALRLVKNPGLEGMTDAQFARTLGRKLTSRPAPPPTLGPVLDALDRAAEALHRWVAAHRRLSPENQVRLKARIHRIEWEARRLATAIRVAN